MSHPSRSSLALLLITLGCGEPPQDLAPLWSWEDGEVLAMPAVADLDGDGTPEVLAVIGRIGGPSNYPIGAVVALDGATGAVRWRHDDALGRTTVAIGDLDGDARPDVVYAGRQNNMLESALIAVDADGKRLWTSRTAAGEPALVRVVNGAFTLANLDDDPGAEIAIGGALFDNDGLLIWEGPGVGSALGSPHGVGNPDQLLYAGSLATFVDLTGDGRPELLTGKHAWTISWTPGDPPTVVVDALWIDTAGLAGDGYPAVADLDANGTPEVVLSAWPEIHVLDGATGRLWCGVDPTGQLCQANDAVRTAPIPIPGNNLGGPPTIADFDGDGRPEVAISSGTELTLFDFHRPDEDLVRPAGDPEPQPGAIFKRWLVPIQDNSSGSNGVAAFDFDGDGAADLAHQDECHVRLLDGPTGAIIRQFEHSSSTIHEYPVVVDVNNDGTTDLVVAASTGDPQPQAQCAEKAGVPELPRIQGIFVHSDSAWPAARPLWTSHTHHLSNVDDRGNAPAQESPAWQDRNSFRENFAP